MRRDDILLNELYRNIKTEQLDEGLRDIYNTAKQKVGSFFKKQETDEILRTVNDLKQLLIKTGYDPKKIFNYEELKAIGNEQPTQPTPSSNAEVPPEWGSPTRSAMETPSEVTPEPVANPVTPTKPTAIASTPTPPPSKPRETAMYNAVQRGELNKILKGKDPMGYKVPDDLKDPKTNKMTGPEVMEYLGVDMEELNFLVTKLKAFSFKNNKIDASDVEGIKYLRIQQALKERDDQSKEEATKKPTAVKKSTATKKPNVVKKPAAVKKPSKKK